MTESTESDPGWGVQSVMTESTESDPGWGVQPVMELREELLQSALEDLVDPVWNGSDPDLKDPDLQDPVWVVDGDSSKGI